MIIKNSNINNNNYNNVDNNHKNDYGCILLEKIFIFNNIKISIVAQ